MQSNLTYSTHSGYGWLLQVTDGVLIPPFLLRRATIMHRKEKTLQSKVVASFEWF